MRRVFDAGFVWGTATAAFQVEGAPDADGREPSIWDDFCLTPGAIAHGDDGRRGVDHYRRWGDDVEIMAGLGVSAYRFSVSWPRVLHADGRLNRAGLGFYDRLVDALLQRGIDPWLTLFHWDLPSSIPGGWLARDTASRFAEYAVAVHAALGDRVTHFATLNEPWCPSVLGYGAGVHAPGHTSHREAFVAAHHLLLAHGLGMRALREAGVRKVGIVLNHTPAYPADPASAADVDVARRSDGTNLRLFADPLFRGAYPDDVVADAGADWPAEVVREGDLALIAAPIDFLGINYYSTQQVGSRPGVPLTPAITAPGLVEIPRGLPTTEMGWEVDPDGFRRMLVRLHREYTGPAGLPLYVTENGAAMPDEVDADGAVHDADRIAYLRDHLTAVADARAEGADIRGYFVWSLLDNFEWAAGFEKRFGLVRVADDGVRYPKDSAAWFARVVASGDPQG